ncbi:MAG: AbrB/MazE/SpoVT family DNA-binding domain-containing protein [Acidimicrobiia bacterium]
MITTIDAAGRIVIPKALREKAGLLPGIKLVVEADATGVHIEPASGSGTGRDGRFVVIPASGAQINDDLVDRLRRGDQR